MAKYAKNTKVPVSRTKIQVQELLVNYGIKENDMIMASILSGEWDTGILQLSGMPKDYVLSARKLMVLEIDEYDELQAELKQNKFLLEHGTAALLKAKNAEIKRLKEDIGKVCVLIRNTKRPSKWKILNWLEQALKGK